MRRALAAALALAALVLCLPTSVSADTAPVRVLFIGDSLTSQLGPMQHLRDRLDAAGFAYELFNGGVGGIGTPGVVVELPAVIHAVQPDIVVISIGTNDDLSDFQDGYYAGQPLIGGPKPAPQDFEQRMHTLLDKVRQSSPTARMLVSINQCDQVPPAPAWINMRTKNNIIYRTAYDIAGNRLTAQVAGFVSLDRIPPSFMSPDGFHPGPQGQLLEQDQFYRALAPLYGLPAIPDDPALTASCT